MSRSIKCLRYFHKGWAADRVLARSRLCVLEGFLVHAEQANIRVRRYGRREVPYAGAAD